MIIKTSNQGRSRASVAALAAHLLSHENEKAAVIEMRGVTGSLADALEDMRALSLGTRSRRPLMHASISLSPAEAQKFTIAQWVEAANALETAHGLTGHQRAVVLHIKPDAKGRSRPHLHVVWNRVNAETLQVAHDGWGYRKNMGVARHMERRFGLMAVSTPKETPTPKSRTTYADHQTAKRAGAKVEDTIDVLRRCWDRSLNGRAFAAAVEAAGLSLARGHRGIVAVDKAGVHSLSRRLGLKAAEVRHRLADLDPAALPTVEQVQQGAVRLHPPGRNDMRKPFAASRPKRKRDRYNEAPQPLSPDYWRDLGFEVDVLVGKLMVRLSPDCLLEDRGDGLTLHRQGEPTPDDIKAMVTAAKARGWTGIHFHGGADPKWQQAARLEALRQGFRWEDITLESEEGQPKPPASLAPLPDHIRKRLTPQDEPQSGPKPDETPVPEQAPLPVPGL